MKLPIEKLLYRIENPFQLVIVAAKRVKQLTNKAPKFVEVNCSKNTTLALLEIMENKISFTRLKEEKDEEGEKEKDEKATAVKE